jgi:hypothetical protein
VPGLSAGDTTSLQPSNLPANVVLVACDHTNPNTSPLLTGLTFHIYMYLFPYASLNFNPCCPRARYLLGLVLSGLNSLVNNLLAQ